MEHYIIDFLRVSDQVSDQQKKKAKETGGLCFQAILEHFCVTYSNIFVKQPKMLQHKSQSWNVFFQKRFAWISKGLQEFFSESQLRWW